MRNSSKRYDEMKGILTDECHCVGMVREVRDEQFVRIDVSHRGWDGER